MIESVPLGAILVVHPIGMYVVNRKNQRFGIPNRETQLLSSFWGAQIDQVIIEILFCVEISEEAHACKDRCELLLCEFEVLRITNFLHL
jgi:hypothetical protein